MEELTMLLIGVILLILGVPIGNLLAKMTKEELKIGKPWFKSIVYLSLAGGIAAIILGSDFLMFSLFFIAIVTSRSIK